MLVRVLAAFFIAGAAALPTFDVIAFAWSALSMANFPWIAFLCFSKAFARGLVPFSSELSFGYADLGKVGGQRILIILVCVLPILSLYNTQRQGKAAHVGMISKIRAIEFCCALLVWLEGVRMVGAVRMSLVEHAAISLLPLFPRSLLRRSSQRILQQIMFPLLAVFVLTRPFTYPVREFQDSWCRVIYMVPPCLSVFHVILQTLRSQHVMRGAQTSHNTWVNAQRSAVFTAWILLTPWMLWKAIFDENIFPLYRIEMAVSPAIAVVAISISMSNKLACIVPRQRSTGRIAQLGCTLILVILDWLLSRDAWATSLSTLAIIVGLRYQRETWKH